MAGMFLFPRGPCTSCGIRGKWGPLKGLVFPEDGRSLCVFFWQLVGKVGGVKMSGSDEDLFRLLLLGLREARLISDVDVEMW